MKYLLFDLDGTITDPALGITNSVKYALKHYGIKEEYENLLKFIGPPLFDSFKNFYHFNDEKANEAIKIYREYFSEKGLYENKVYPGMKELLKKLKEEGYTLIVATSKAELFAKKIMEHFELDSYFDAICGASMDQSRNKKADVIAYALDRYPNIDLNEAIMIGDRLHDIEGAHERGLKAIGVLYGYGSQEEMETYKADYIVKNLDELYQLIHRL